MTRQPGYAGHSDIEVNAAIANTPVDRVRWGPIIAGLFVALSTLVLLTVLGLAISATAYDSGDQLSNYGIFAGIWGAVSALLAFAIGGWWAARSSAVAGTHNGLMNGFMVWAVAIPLLLLGLGSSITSLAGTTASVASNTAGAAAETANNQGVTSGDITDQAQQASQQIRGNLPSGEQVAEAGEQGAWTTLIALVLGLIAALAGGYLGARRRFPDHDHDHDGRTTTDRPATAATT